MIFPKTGRLHKIVEQFPAQIILVVGDLILDQFVWGRVDRISPEAPVPVVEVTKETCHLGGAANVAANLASTSNRISKPHTSVSSSRVGPNHFNQLCIFP